MKFSEVLGKHRGERTPGRGDEFTGEKNLGREGGLEISIRSQGIEEF
jgi:hypothetical protein